MNSKTETSTKLRINKSHFKRKEGKSFKNIIIEWKTILRKQIFSYFKNIKNTRRFQVVKKNLKLLKITKEQMLNSQFLEN